ncbi:MAG: hypothetical protein ACKVS8_08255 [Phycisphaerales bacterium]
MLSVYIETSVWSFAFADDSPDYTRDTLAFFDVCRAGRFTPLLSAIALREIAGAPEPLRSRLLALVKDIGPAVLPSVPEAEALATAFVQHGAAPPSKPEDAAHVAIAVVAGCDVLVSLNFKHITNVNRAQRFNAIAALRGFTKPLRIVAPAELIHE